MDIYRHFTGGPQRAKDNVGAWMVFRLGGTEDAFLDQLRHQRVILCQLPNLRSSDEVRATVSDMGDERLVISDDEHRQGPPLKPRVTGACPIIANHDGYSKSFRPYCAQALRLFRRKD